MISQSLLHCVIHLDATMRCSRRLRRRLSRHKILELPFHVWMLNMFRSRQWWRTVTAGKKCRRHALPGRLFTKCDWASLQGAFAHCLFNEQKRGLPFKVNKALRDAPKLPQDLRFKRLFMFWPELIRSYDAKPWFSRSIPHTLFLEWPALMIWEDLFGPVESGAWRLLLLACLDGFLFDLEEQFSIIQQCNVWGCLIFDVVDLVILIASCSNCSRHPARYACNSASKQDVAQSSSESPIKDWTRILKNWKKLTRAPQWRLSTGCCGVQSRASWRSGVPRSSTVKAVKALASCNMLWEFGGKTWKNMETQLTAFRMMRWCQKCLQKSKSTNCDIVHWRNRNIQTVKLSCFSLLYVMSLIFKPHSSFAQRQRFPPNWATSCSSGHGYMRCRERREMGWVMNIETILKGNTDMECNDSIWFYCFT